MDHYFYIEPLPDQMRAVDDISELIWIAAAAHCTTSQPRQFSASTFYNPK